MVFIRFFICSMFIFNVQFSIRSNKARESTQARVSMTNVILHRKIISFYPIFLCLIAKYDIWFFCCFLEYKLMLSMHITFASQLIHYWYNLLKYLKYFYGYFVGASLLCINFCIMFCYMFPIVCNAYIIFTKHALRFKIQKLYIIFLQMLFNCNI